MKEIKADIYDNMAEEIGKWMSEPEWNEGIFFVDFRECAKADTMDESLVPLVILVKWKNEGVEQIARCECREYEWELMTYAISDMDWRKP